MSPLNIHPEEDRAVSKKKNNKVLKVILGISALIAVPVIGTTLAASITINSTDPIQFGQGVQRAVVCDDAVTMTALADYANATDAAGAFTLGDVSLSGIAAGCEAKSFKIKIYDNGANDAPIASCVVTTYGAADGTSCAAGSTAGVTWGANFDALGPEAENNLTVYFGSMSPKLDSTTVYNITIEAF
jgi:hypothetical protein